MLKFIVSTLIGAKELVKIELAKKIQNKELLPNIIKLVNFFFLFIAFLFQKDNGGVKKFLIQYIPVLNALTGVILKDLLDEDKDTTDLTEVDLELLD